MKKKILIGSMLVLTLLLLMPSIPAIQQKAIEEEFKQDLQEKLDTITLDAEALSSVFAGINFPFLFIAILIIFILILSFSMFVFFCFMLMFFS